MTEQQQKIEIKKQRGQGFTIREIAKRMNLTKYRVEQILQQKEETAGQATMAKMLLEPYREQIVKWVEESKMTAKLIHKRLGEKLINLSESTVLRYLRGLKKPEVYVHVITKPGQEAQVDFGYFGVFIKDGKKVKVWVFCMVLSYSRYAFYKIVTDQSTATFLKCHQDAFEFFGAVPKSVITDNLRAGVLEANFYQPLIQKQYADFLKHYNCVAITAKICCPTDKGVVESGIKYVKNGFLRNVESKDYYQLETDLQYWNKTVCNLRQHRTTQNIPQEDFITKEKGKLLSLPLSRYEYYAYEERVVNTFGHIYYRYNQYSVPHHYLGEKVRIAISKTVIKIFKEDLQIAMHVIAHAKGKMITEEKHKPYHKRAKTKGYYRELMEKIGLHAVALLDLMIEQRPLEWKKMCNGIRRLGENYSISIVNDACRQAIALRKCDYRKVKELCETRKETNQKKTDPVLGAGGYAHDLKKYDHFVTVYPL